MSEWGDFTERYIDGSIHCWATFDYHCPHGEFEPYPIQAHLSWEPSDPVAVTVEFYGRNGIPAVWCFSRDLLASGMLAPAGCGDVRVLPAVNGQLRVVLDSPSGHADFSVDVETVESFLAATFAVCLPGCEFDGWDVEAELLSLLMAEES